MSYIGDIKLYLLELGCLIIQVDDVGDDKGRGGLLWNACVENNQVKSQAFPVQRFVVNAIGYLQLKLVLLNLLSITDLSNSVEKASSYVHMAYCKHCFVVCCPCLLDVI